MRGTDRAPWLPGWWRWGRKEEGASLVDSQVSGPGNGRFTVMGMPTELPLRADDFRWRYAVWSAYGI